MMQKLSKTKAELTFARENKNFRMAIEDGVDHGFLCYPKSTTTSYAISILGGRGSVKGVGVENDADAEEVLDLGGNNKHCLVFIDTRPDIPIYAFKEGTFGSPATLDPAEQEFGLKIADVWIPASASSIQDALIVNVSSIRPRLSRQTYFSPQRFRVTSSGPSNYKLEMLGGQLITMSNRRTYDEQVVNFPVVIHDIVGDNAATDANYIGGYEIDINLISDEYILFYVKIPPAETVTPADARIESVTFASDVLFDASQADLREFFSAAITDPVMEQSRFDLDDIFIVALVDSAKNAVLTPLGSIRVGDEYQNGFFDSYVRTVSSTAYGTGPINATSGNIDLDLLITNAPELVGMGLSDLYQGVGTNGPDGNIFVNFGAVTLTHSPNEQIPAPLRVVQSGFDVSEIGVDIVGEARGLVYRKQVFNGTLNFTDFGGSGVEIGSVGSVTPIGEPEQKYMLVVSGTGGGADLNYYYLRSLTNSFVLVNAQTGSIATVSGDFNGNFTSVPSQLFEVVAEISEVSRLEDIIVTNDIFGPLGGRFNTENVSLGTSFTRIEQIADSVPNYHTAVVRGAAQSDSTSSEFTFSAIDVHSNQRLISAVNAAGNVRVYDPVQSIIVFSYTIPTAISNPKVSQFDDNSLFVSNGTTLYVWQDYTINPTPVTVNIGTAINDIMAMKEGCYLAHAYTSAFGSGSVLTLSDTLGSISDLGIGGVGDVAEEIASGNNEIALRLSDGFVYIRSGNQTTISTGGSASDSITIDNKFIYRATNVAPGSFTIEKIEKFSGAVVDSSTLGVGASEIKIHSIEDDQLLLFMPDTFGLNIVQIETGDLSITRNFFDAAITGSNTGSHVDGEKCVIGCGFTEVLAFRYNFKPSTWMPDDQTLFSTRRVKCCN